MHWSEAEKLDRIWVEFSAPIPGLEGAEIVRGISVTSASDIEPRGDFYDTTYRYWTDRFRARR